MFSKIVYVLGIAASVVLAIACFLPWAYYADIDKTFTGLYSFKNEYGRPGIFILPLTTIIFLFMLLPALWAKRANLFIAALLLGYCIKSFFLFTNCYMAYCPEKKWAVYVILIAPVFILLAAIFPTIKVKKGH
jgi:hypothetical protein